MNFSRTIVRQSLGTLAATALLAAMPLSAQTMVGITTSNTIVVVPDISNPANAMAVPFTLSLPGSGQQIVGMDIRPATNDVYLLGYNATTGAARLYRLDRVAAIITEVGTQSVMLDLGAGAVGFDFNPTVDRLRVVGQNGRNYRLNPNDGSIAATDTDLAFAVGDTYDGQSVNLGAIAYTNNVAGTGTTALYGYDLDHNTLVVVSPPNAGIVTTVGAAGVVVNPDSGTIDMDVFSNPATGTSTMYMVANPNSEQGDHLYTIDLTTGSATDLGPVGFPAAELKLMAMVPAISEEVSGPLAYVLAEGGMAIGSFDAEFPATLRSLHAITGLDTNQTILGIDVRPSTGELWGLAYNYNTGLAQLYTVAPSTGAATPRGLAPFEIALEAGPTGFDFNPVVDRIRIVTSGGRNYRVNPITGTVAATDTDLAFALADPNMGATPVATAAAYTNSYIGSETTALYIYDEALNVLAMQNPPNLGTLNTIGSSGIVVNRDRPTVDMDIVFDTASRTNVAYLQANTGTDSTDHLYRVNLATGAATELGTIGSFGFSALDIAFAIDNSTTDTPPGQLLVGLTRAGSVITFASGDPERIRSLAPVAGLTNGQRLAGIDFRPATMQLYALGYDSAARTAQIYTLDYTTGIATAVNAEPTPLELGNGRIGFDFNPVVDRIRIVSTTGANYRINPTDGSVAAMDTALAFAPADVNAGRSPGIHSIAYSNSYFGSTATSLLAINDSLNILAAITSPNSGAVSTVATLPIMFNLGDRASDIDMYYDSATTSNIAFLAAKTGSLASSELYTFNVGTGEMTRLGTIGMGLSVTDIATRVTYSGITTSVSSLEHAQQVLVHPNPVQDFTNIILPRIHDSFGTIRVLSSTGVKVAEFEIDAFTDRIALNLAGLPVGFYTAIVSYSNTMTYTARMIKF